MLIGGGGGGMYIHIFMFCPTDFFSNWSIWIWFGKKLVAQNTNIWIYPPPINALATALCTRQKTHQLLAMLCWPHCLQLSIFFNILTPDSRLTVHFNIQLLTAVNNVDSTTSFNSVLQMPYKKFWFNAGWQKIGSVWTNASSHRHWMWYTDEETGCWWRTLFWNSKLNRNIVYNVLKTCMKLVSRKYIPNKNKIK